MSFHREHYACCWRICCSVSLETSDLDLAREASPCSKVAPGSASTWRTRVAWPSTPSRLTLRLASMSKSCETFQKSSRLLRITFQRRKPRSCYRSATKYAGRLDRKG